MLNNSTRSRDDYYQSAMKSLETEHSEELYEDGEKLVISYNRYAQYSAERRDGLEAIGSMLANNFQGKFDHSSISFTPSITSSILGLGQMSMSINFDNQQNASKALGKLQDLKKEVPISHSRHNHGAPHEKDKMLYDACQKKATEAEARRGHSRFGQFKSENKPHPANNTTTSTQSETETPVFSGPGS